MPFEAVEPALPQDARLSVRQADAARTRAVRGTAAVRRAGLSRHRRRPIAWGEGPVSNDSLPLFDVLGQEDPERLHEFDDGLTAGVHSVDHVDEPVRQGRVGEDCAGHV